MLLQPCSLFFDAQWHHPARILWGGGKDALALHKTPWHELLLEGSCPPTGRDFSTREVSLLPNPNFEVVRGGLKKRATGA